MHFAMYLRGELGMFVTKSDEAVPLTCRFDVVPSWPAVMVGRRRRGSRAQGLVWQPHITLRQRRRGSLRARNVVKLRKLQPPSEGAVFREAVQ